MKPLVGQYKFLKYNIKLVGARVTAMLDVGDFTVDIEGDVLEQVEALIALKPDSLLAKGLAFLKAKDAEAQDADKPADPAPVVDPAQPVIDDGNGNKVTDAPVADPAVNVPPVDATPGEVDPIGATPAQGLQ